MRITKNMVVAKNSASDVTKTGYNVLWCLHIYEFTTELFEMLNNSQQKHR